MKSISYRMTSTSFRWWKSSQSDIIVLICSIGPESLCVTCVGKTTLAEGFDSAHTTNAAPGSNTPVNLPNVDAAAEQNIAVKNARRARGLFTATGVLQRRRNKQDPTGYESRDFWT